ncbi:MAG: glycosyltransferase [Nakamurella sp.]
MHVIESYFECGGFDHRFVQGGTSMYLWNLARSIAQVGHTVSIVTPAHGRLDDLRAIGAVQLDYIDRYRLPLTLDTRTWRDFPERVDLPLETRVWQLSLDGVDLYFLSNALLDQLPDSFYPDYDTKGTDLVFFKGIGHQVDSVRFIRNFLLRDENGPDPAIAEPVLLHAHEPFYHYLMPAAFYADPRVRVVSTVQSNMPIGKSEYAPLVRGLLMFLKAPVDLPPADPPPAADLIPMIQYQQRTHLHYAYPGDHVRIYDLVARWADRVCFLSDGHLRFYETFAGTPFEQLFEQLPVAETVRESSDRRFVGGCAIGDSWLSPDGPIVDREAVLQELGLDARWPTFFHNARFAIHHKGQVELMRAIGRVLDSGVEANFVLRMLTDSDIQHPVFDEVLARHADRIYLETARVTDERIRQYATSSQFCLFPSKFEMDTFLIAMGEAMACGAVPIATAQEGMAHFGHVEDPLADPEQATGFALPRSFAEDDDLLVAALTDAIFRALALHRDDPELYARLSANAVRRARLFSWSQCATDHLSVFADVVADQPSTRPPDHRQVREFSASRDAFSEIPSMHINGNELHCHLPGLQRVELVLPGSLTDVRAEAQVFELARHGDRWQVQLPPQAPPRLDLLLTMRGGDTRWAVVQHV